MNQQQHKLEKRNEPDQSRSYSHTPFDSAGGENGIPLTSEKAQEMHCQPASQRCFMPISACHTFRIQSRGCILVPQTHMPCGRNNQLVVRGELMSGPSARAWSRGFRRFRNIVVLGALGVACLAPTLPAQERREREANSVYAERRAKLAAQVDGPILLWGFAGREESSQTYIFHQEDNFYYLTGHNEEGSGMIVLPALKNGVV
jgi:hypothetical protein